MNAVWFLLAALISAPVLRAADSRRFLTPFYSAASIVHSATNAPASFAPNTIATLYGTNLAAGTRALTGDDVINGLLPTTLAGVRVFVSGTPAHLYYVSPVQINFLIPSSFRAGDYDLWITRDGAAGPIVRITLRDAAPGLFQLDPWTALATHADGSLLTPQKPAAPNEVVILYAAGLGRTNPDVIVGRVASIAAPLRALSDFRIVFAGRTLETWRTAYAGIAPGFAGLYQINVQLPGEWTGEPEIRAAVGEEISPAALKLPVAPP